MLDQTRRTGKRSYGNPLKAFEDNPEKVALAVLKGNGKPSDS